MCAEGVLGANAYIGEDLRPYDLMIFDANDAGMFMRISGNPVFGCKMMQAFKLVKPGFCHVPGGL